MQTVFASTCLEKDLTGEARMAQHSFDMPLAYFLIF